MHFCGFLKKISGVYYHETCRFRLLNFVLKMRQNSPTNICDFEKFPRGYTPEPPLKGKEGKRKGEGIEEEDREGEGREKGGEGGMGREREWDGRGRKGEGRRRALLVFGPFRRS
jgi:hypothetical protein